ncbi:hypothetical protein GQ651_17245 [Alphaproteobacteria bacterium GH1-50]|uniref:Lipoprotein n=1 Tax=Kangsaoukella pontilimi TaxID=2691042 RepID=A0A7C9MZ11_9RHOB|nr:hypothetical protein [Kangsaoukella pontilimi]MXQ09594.1 hypothetical protein [Kangsaoukella pontilimi]
MGALRNRHAACSLALLLFLSACGGPAEPVWAPDDAVARARYVHDAPPSVTLFTVVSTRNGSGGHSGLLINGDERILFDPAGTFRLPFAPERNDVHFGMTKRAVDVYIDYHARETFDVVVQEAPVTLDQARRLTALVKDYGAVPKAQCSLSIARILQDVPGFEGVRTTYFPNSLSEQFGEATGATRRVISDDDADKNHNVLMVASQSRPQG